MSLVVLLHDSEATSHLFSNVLICFHIHFVAVFEPLIYKFLQNVLKKFVPPLVPLVSTVPV